MSDWSLDDTRNGKVKKYFDEKNPFLRICFHFFIWVWFKIFKCQNKSRKPLWLMKYVVDIEKYRSWVQRERGKEIKTGRGKEKKKTKRGNENECDQKRERENKKVKDKEWNRKEKGERE